MVMHDLYDLFKENSNKKKECTFLIDCGQANQDIYALYDTHRMNPFSMALKLAFQSMSNCYDYFSVFG